MLPNIGPLEIAVLLIIALVVFGPRRLPELGSSLGKGLRNFGKGLKGEEDRQESLDRPADRAATMAASEESKPSR